MFSYLKKRFQAKPTNAALAWQRLGNDASSGYWLYAVPVHLALQRDSFNLASVLNLESEEIEVLTPALNQHFASDGMQFFWYQNQWFLRLKSNPNIHTYPPENAINKDINAFLPIGEGATQWAALTNELQMLLFAHPVNHAREAKGLPAVNSIWCYGLGKL